MNNGTENVTRFAIIVQFNPRAHTVGCPRIVDGQISLPEFWSCWQGGIKPSVITGYGKQAKWKGGSTNDNLLLDGRSMGPGHKKTRSLCELAT